MFFFSVCPTWLQITPGKKSPNISPLEMEGWCAVSSLVVKNSSADVMDQLTAIGATDILLFDLCNSRM